MVVGIPGFRYTLEVRCHHIKNGGTIWIMRNPYFLNKMVVHKLINQPIQNWWLDFQGTAKPDNVLFKTFTNCKIERVCF